MVELLSVAEVAKLFRLHEMTIRRQIKRGRLKAVKVGGRIRVRKDDVERFMQPVPATARFDVPRVTPPSAEEIARRRMLFDQVMRLREEIGPIGVTADQFLGRHDRFR